MLNRDNDPGRVSVPPLEQQVSASTKRLIRASVSENTRRAYEHALRALEEWLSGRALTDALVAEYLTCRHDEGLAPSSLSMIPAAIQFASRLSGRASPLGLLTENTMMGIRKEGRERGNGQVTGISFMEARFMAAQIAGDGVRGIRDAAIIALMSDCMLRIGELVAVRPKDVTDITDGTGRLHLPRSKTDQEGEGATLFIGAPTMDRLKTWMGKVEEQLGSVDVSGPLFHALRKGGKIQPTGLSARAVRKNIQSYAARLKLKGRFSGHSFRVGTAQSLAQERATLAQLQSVGRWKSARMPASYCRNELAGRSAVAQLLYRVEETPSKRESVPD